MKAIFKRPKFWIYTGLVVVAVSFLAPPRLLLSLPINSEYTEVDIMTGRIRYKHYILFCKVEDYVEPSALSEVLPPDMVASAKPKWFPVYSSTLAQPLSPNYRYHAAINQIQKLELFWDGFEVMEQLGPFPEELKPKTAMHVLALWQHSCNDDLAEQYINALWGDQDDNTNTWQKTLAVLSNLKMPLVETNGSIVA